MKARVKATGEIVEISTFQDNDKLPTTYDENELEFLIPNDYWTRLEHQYAGQFMQAMIISSDYIDVSEEAMADASLRIAHALVEKLKEMEERK